jgi:hypothetical protein
VKEGRQFEPYEEEENTPMVLDYLTPTITGPTPNAYETRYENDGFTTPY